MIRRGPRALMVMATTVAAVTAGALHAQQTPANAPAVWIAANVIHADGHLVADLAAKDFDVTDNGKPATITVFRNDPIPLALALMIDVSSSMESNYGLVRRAITALTSHFEAGDRAVLGSFDALPWIGARFSARPEVLQHSLGAAFGGTLFLCDGDWIDKVSLTSRASERAGNFGQISQFARRTMMHSGSAIWDGAACGVNAVASDGETPRRIVVLFTDGEDNASSSTVANVVGRANQAGVMIYAVSLMGGYGMAGGALKGLAEATGGGYFFLTGEDKVADAFTRIGDELRHQYVFGIAASDPAAPHELHVRATTADTTTRSRRVMMESPGGRSLSSMRAPVIGTPADATSGLPPSFTSTRRPAPSQPVTTPAAPRRARTAFWDTLDRFTSATWHTGVAPRMTIDELRSLNVTLRRDGEDWIASEPADLAGRRIAAASYVLDVLYSQNDPYLWLDRQPVPDLLDWAAGVMQTSAPLPEERLWYFGAAALIERAGVPDLLERFADRAQRRFPDEARFVLARAVAAEMRTWPEERDDHAFVVAPAVAAAVVSRYETAIALPPVANDALLRLGFFEVRRGRSAAGIARLDAIDLAQENDPVLRFWIHLIKGRALDSAGRAQDAVAEFQLALDDVPGATSARASLVAALASLGQSSQAARAANSALTMPAAAVDPWTMWVLPDMRFWDSINAQLRRLVVR